MSLTSTEIIQILVDELRGDPPTVLGKEADELRIGLKADIAMARENGWEIDIPTEWPEND